MRLLSKLILLSAFLFTGASAFAMQPSYETKSIGGNIVVQDSETQTLWLSQARYIRNIVVQASGIRNDSMVEVMVNGEVKGTIFAPGRDPSYIVTIGETASSIQFRHRSGGSMRISDLTATLSVWAGQPGKGGGGLRGSSSQIEDLANRSILAIEAIRRYSSLSEEQTYLMPIKKKAGQVLVMAGARGDYSRRTVAALLALQYQIDFASEYISSMMEQDGLFNEAVELLTIRESIDDLLD